jgi:hypothetical protein
VKEAAGYVQISSRPQRARRHTAHGPGFATACSGASASHVFWSARRPIVRRALWGVGDQLVAAFIAPGRPARLFFQHVKDLDPGHEPSATSLAR